MDLNKTSNPVLVIFIILAGTKSFPCRSAVGGETTTFGGFVKAFLKATWTRISLSGLTIVKVLSSIR